MELSLLNRLAFRRAASSWRIGKRLIARIQIRGVAVFLILTLVLVIGGCAPSATRLNTPTGGFDLSFFERDASGAEVYYEVKRDGTLGYGGGLDARLEKVTWTGQLTPEEIQQLRTILQQQDWFRAEPPSTKQPPDQRYRVLLNAPENRADFTVKGESAALESLRGVLSGAALRRLDDDLKKLPQPSVKQ